MKHIISLRQGFINLKDSGQNNQTMAMSVNHQLMVYGYMLDQPAYDQLKSANAADIVEFHDECVKWLKEMTGGKHNFRSLYNNFPNDVMSKSRLELFIDQIMHYWGKMEFDPAGKPKEEAFEHVEYKMLTAGNDEKFMQIFTDFCSVGQSLTPTDTNVLKWFANSGLNLKFPSTIPFKENLATLAVLLPQFTVQNVTDCLRIAVGMSGGDVSMPAVPKSTHANLVRREAFKFKLDGEQKVRLLELMEGSNLSLQEMKQGSKYNRWIRLGEHIGHIDKLKYPKTANAFYRLRNQKRKGKPNGSEVIRTWYSQVEEAFKGSFQQGIKKLSERPSEFVRRLDSLIRQNKDTKLVLDTLVGISSKVSTKVLLEVYGHFESRKVQQTNRSVFIKGARSKTNIPTLPPLDERTADTVQSAVADGLKSKFKELSDLGKCWIDPELRKIPLPTNMRSMSESLIPVIRGQRMKVGTTKKVLRPFVHWYDERGNEDLDLHGFLLGDDKVMSFGFNGSYNEEFGNYSGDVRHRKGSCAEYVDIKIDEAVEGGYDYFVQVVHNFQIRPFSSLNDCYVGCMERDDAVENSTWKPDTVVNCMKLTSDAEMCLVGMYDLRTREYIHLDMDWRTFSGYVTTGNASQLLNAVKEYINPPKLSVYDLLTWHVEARRGSIVDKGEAETKFEFETFKGSYTETLKYI